MITIKTEAEIDAMREPCAIVRDTLAYVGSKVKPGVTTAELDAFAEEYIRFARRRSFLPRLLRVSREHLRVRQ